ncbi:GAP family protein [Streptomyces sp. NPDC005017]|uniref:GAP family protein n=1 Tax=Streptomyces sp. NPDC005017 TaxID=3364706 RepID=UPI0036896A71
MVLDLVIIGLAIAVFPLSVTAFVLVLSARGGTWKGLAFILAWLACFVGVLAIVLFATGGKPPAPRSPPSTASSAVKLAVGVGLIAYGWYRHRRGPRRSDSEEADGEESDTPRRQPGGMMSRLDRSSVWTAAAMGPLLQPWGLVAAGAATVVGADLSHTSSYLALAVYCVLATSSLLAMEIYAAVSPDAAHERLGKLRAWLQSHQNQALVAVSLTAGVFLVGRSIYALAA